MVWRMRLDVEDDRDHPRSRLRAWGAVAVTVLLVSLWIIAVTILAVWLAGVVTR